ncbi:MAG: Tfp pilus assembly protein PilV [Rubritalea sp.]
MDFDGAITDQKIINIKIMKLLHFSRNRHVTDKRHNLSATKTRKGFSLVEVAIAMGVVTLLLTTFLGVFGPAQKNIQRALSTKDASRMKDTLSNEMSILRSSDTAFTSSFEKAFKMIKNSHDSNKAVIMYQYRADTAANSDSDGDGILSAYLATDGIQGKDYIIQTAVRTLGSSTTIEDELKAVNGPVFAIRMTQLVRDPDSTATKLILSAWADAGDVPIAGITDPDSPDTGNKYPDPDGKDATDPKDDYPKAVIAFRAEFFKLSANKFGFINGGKWTLDTENIPEGMVSMGNALTEVNMAIRR